MLEPEVGFSPSVNSDMPYPITYRCYPLIIDCTGNKVSLASKNSQILLFPDPTTKLFSGSLYRIPIICNYIQIKPCRDDPLLVKSGTKVSIKYLACLSARPSVSRDSVHYPKLRFISPKGEVRTQRSWRW